MKSEQHSHSFDMHIDGVWGGGVEGVWGGRGGIIVMVMDGSLV